MNDIENLPKTQKEAKVIGSQYYFTGKPCSRGHIEKRLTNSGDCLECRKLKQIEYRITNKDKIRTQQKQWKVNNRKKRLDIQKKYRDKNKEKHRKEYKEKHQKIENVIYRSIKRHLRKLQNPEDRYWSISMIDVIQHIESLFSNEMNWANYRKKWHLEIVKTIEECNSVEEFKSLSNFCPRVCGVDNKFANIFTKEYLIQKFLVEDFSVMQIAKLHGCDKITVQNYINKHKVRGKYSKNWKGFGDISKSNWSSIKRTAHNRDIPFDYSIKQGWSLFESQNHKCKLSGFNLNFTVDRIDMNASLDRIDSNKKIGYIEGNVHWVHKDINKIKYTFNIYEFIKYAYLISYPIITEHSFVEITNIKNSKWHDIRKRSQQKEIELTIQKQDLIDLFNKQNGKCYLTGLPITIHNSSVDRLDSNKWYTMDNIGWCLTKLNHAKWDFHIDYYRELNESIFKNLNQNPNHEYSRILTYFKHRYNGETNVSNFIF